MQAKMAFIYANAYARLHHQTGQLDLIEGETRTRLPVPPQIKGTIQMYGYCAGRCLGTSGGIRKGGTLPWCQCLASRSDSQRRWRRRFPSCVQQARTSFWDTSHSSTEKRWDWCWRMDLCSQSRGRCSEHRRCCCCSTRWTNSDWCWVRCTHCS